MNTKLIGALIILLVVWAGYRVYVYWEEIEQQSWTEREPSGENLDPTTLDGMPRQLETSLRQAQEHGAEALGIWLATHGNQIRDPRKAWIQLDYCTLLAREDPPKARQVFLSVQERIGTNSPVYPRLTQLKKSFE